MIQRDFQQMTGNWDNMFIMFRLDISIGRLLLRVQYFGTSRLNLGVSLLQAA